MLSRECYGLSRHNKPLYLKGFLLFKIRKKAVWEGFRDTFKMFSIKRIETK
jgi:hypothetical protein